MTESFSLEQQEFEDFSVRKVQSILGELEPFGRLSERELHALLLQETASITGVDSVHLVWINGKGTLVRLAWMGLDGSLEYGEWLPLASSPWRGALELEGLWLQRDAATKDVQELPELETSFHDRCLIPIVAQSKTLGLLVLQSTQAEVFTSWEQSVLQLFAQQLGFTFQSFANIENLGNRLEQHNQQARMHPASLEGMLQMSRAFLSEATPIVTYSQHNLEALQVFTQKLQGTIDFYLDEIRLSAGGDAFQRAKKHAEFQQIEDIRADMNSLLRDNREGIFQLRRLTGQLRELNAIQAMQEPVQLPELLTPLLPLVFAEKLTQIRIEKDWQDTLPIYGTKTRLQQAFLTLLFAIQRQYEIYDDSPYLSLSAQEADDEIVLTFSFPRAEQAGSHRNNLEDEYLFARQVLEEHQGSFSVKHHGESGSFVMTFPLMFDESASSGRPREPFDSLPAAVGGSFAAVEMPALTLPAVGIDDEDDESVEESTDESAAKPKAKPSRYRVKKPKPKVLFVGEDERFLRSLNRALGSRFQVFLADSVTIAMDRLTAEPDIELIFIDFQNDAELGLELSDELTLQGRGLIDKVYYLVGEGLHPVASEFAQFRSARCCHRHATLQELEQFIRENTPLGLKEEG